LPALQAKGLSPIDVVNAISAQNLIAPSGTMKIDRFEYAVETNSAPSVVERPEQPAHQGGQRRGHLHPRRGPRARRQSAANQHRARGRQRAILMSIMKIGSASTLDIIAGVQAKLESIKGSCRRSCKSILSPTNRSSCAAPSTAWSARPSSPPASPPS
jgi:multidrug efflux pump subunit AcrB